MTPTPTPTKLWILLESEHDYSFIGAYSTEENAKLVQSFINEIQPFKKTFIDEWVIDPGVAEISQGMRQFNVMMDRDGTVKIVQQLDHVDLDPEVYIGITCTSSIFGVYWATDANHAVQLANLARIQLLGKEPQ